MKEYLIYLREAQGIIYALLHMLEEAVEISLSNGKID